MEQLQIQADAGAYKPAPCADSAHDLGAVQLPAARYRNKSGVPGAAAAAASRAMTSLLLLGGQQRDAAAPLDKVLQVVLQVCVHVHVCVDAACLLTCVLVGPCARAWHSSAAGGNCLMTSFALTAVQENDAAVWC